jgi:hypothetical protein
VCQVPTLFRLFRPKDERHPQRRSQPELARTLLDMVLERFPTPVIELVMDGAYATKAWRGLPNRVTVTTMLIRKPDRSDGPENHHGMCLNCSR